MEVAGTLVQYFGHLMGRVDSLEKTLMLGGIGGRRRRGRQRMRWLDGITDLMDVSLSVRPREVLAGTAEPLAWRVQSPAVAAAGKSWARLAQARAASRPGLCAIAPGAELELRPTLCDPMNRSMPGIPVHHQLPEFTQTHVHRGLVGCSPWGLKNQKQHSN